MLKRTLILCLGLWLMAASALSAHAGPCDMPVEAPEAAAVMDHAHCDMMAVPDDAAPELPAAPDKATDCCCPAVLAALPALDSPVPADFTFARPTSFPLDTRAASRTVLPEPRPPKA
ncbi:MAG: hypothetical protein IPK75_05540 [Acidobacteria bacterium]|nr:hypothetical protein [Acidobacteriota bacterium]